MHFNRLARLSSICAGWGCFQFVEDHKDAYDVKRLCEVVEIARSSFYAWLDAAPRRVPKAAEDVALADRIRVLQDSAQGGDRAYGAPRKFPDLIGRDISIGEPNRRYVGDITYLPIADGTNLYLATCIDLGSQKLAGRQVADHMRIELVEDALRAAARERGTLAGAVFRDRQHHPDHLRERLRGDSLSYPRGSGINEPTPCP